MKIDCENHPWVKWLENAGVIRPGDKVTRVIIDIQVDDIPRVYVNHWGGEKLFSVALPDALTAEVQRAEGHSG